MSWWDKVTAVHKLPKLFGYSGETGDRTITCRWDSMRLIALMLARRPSRICQKVNRNNGLSCYNSISADSATWKRGKRPKHCLPGADEHCIKIFLQK